jgi:uncharacterized lipoprotein YddW (UPF0748 family)
VTSFIRTRRRATERDEYRLLGATVVIVGVFWMAALTPRAQGAPRYRAFWIDTFNTSLNTHGDVLAVVDRARRAHVNTVFVQVRRRGDSWYLHSLEPLADRTPIEPGFDPLADLIGEAHASGIKVHAYVIVGAIWNRDPRLFPPLDQNHVFNRHGFDQSTGQIYEGRDNWLTRTLVVDPSITYLGHRVGSDFWIEPGHPDAAAYTVEVFNHLVRHYGVDGLHLDRVRYPELSIPGQTPETGTSVGYNEINIARFHQRYGFPPESPPPAQNDPLWNQWRRDQVTQLVRRIYLTALAINPRLELSAALIAFGNGPTLEASWPTTEAYWRVYQDWRGWTEEGILDLAIPMNYKTEHTQSGRLAFDQWNEWTKNHTYGRWTMIGQGSYLNAIEGTLRQTRRALEPSAADQTVAGTAFYSMANTHSAVGVNPFSIPPGQDTPVRAPGEFASGLTTGRSVDSTQFYEPPDEHPVAVFADEVPVPEMPWKAEPERGHLMGEVRYRYGHAVDTGDIEIVAVSGEGRLLTTTDGGGFYGGVDLKPGEYHVTVTPVGEPPFVCQRRVTIAPGLVSRLDIIIDREARQTSLRATPAK